MGTMQNPLGIIIWRWVSPGLTPAPLTTHSPFLHQAIQFPLPEVQWGLDTRGGDGASAGGRGLVGGYLPCWFPQPCWDTPQEVIPRPWGLGGGVLIREFLFYLHFGF